MMTKAVRIPEPKERYSSIKDAKTHVQNCITSLIGNELSQEKIDHFWVLDMNLTNRRHKYVALYLREVYLDIDSGTCKNVKDRLKKLLKVLKEANRKRKQPLALKKEGITKA